MDKYKNLTEEEKNQVPDVAYQRVRIALTPPHGAPPPVKVPRATAATPQTIHGIRYEDHHYARLLLNPEAQNVCIESQATMSLTRTLPNILIPNHKPR